MTLSAVTKTYMDTRQKYNRPQAMVFCTEYTTITNDTTELLVPKGVEFEDFIILSDHNRGPIDISAYRIEQRDRMINGTMRSYHIADKMNIATAWTDLPSRAFSEEIAFDANGDASYDETLSVPPGTYTADHGAGGVDLLDWYENHAGAFYVLLAYDHYSNFSTTTDVYGRLNEYNEAKQVFFSDFSYTITKRGNPTYDFWDVSLSLEEV